MTNLEKIQKAMQVFRILTLIAVIGTFLCAFFTFAASMTLFTSAFAGLKKLLFDPIALAANISIVQLRGSLLAFALCCALDGVFLLYAYRYLQAELRAGTPFTQAGADSMRKLGVWSMLLSLAAACVTSAIREGEALEGQLPFDHAGGLVLGLFLILFSLILRYGAELEQQARTQSGDALHKES